MGKIVGEIKIEINRKNSSNGIFALYFTDSVEGSKEISLHTKDKIKAHVKAKEVIDGWGGKKKKPKLDPDEIEVNPLLDQYIEKRRGKVEDIKRLESCVKSLKRFFKGKVVSEIDPDICLEFADWRMLESNPKKTLKPSTARKDLICLSVAMRATLPKSIHEDLEYEYPNVDEVGVEGLTCEQAMKLFRAACRLPKGGANLKKFIVIGFKTGRRKKSIMNLEWDRVYLDKGFIQWHPPHKKKTKKENPVGAIPNGLLKHLRKWREENPTDRYVISRNGESIGDLKRSFQNAVKIAGILDHETIDENGNAVSELKRIYPHMMRHSCATWLMEAGTDIEVACSYLGMTEEVLRKHYWKHHPDFHKSIKDLL